MPLCYHFSSSFFHPFNLYLGSLNKSTTAPINNILMPIIHDGFGPSKTLCVDSDTKIGVSPMIFTAP